MTTQDGAVVSETVERLNEQFRIGLGQDFVIHRIAHGGSSGDGEACTTNVIFKWVDFELVVVERASGPGCD